MLRLVQKYGGTSVATIKNIKNIAQKIKIQWDAGADVFVVVSAMAGETSRLIELVQEASLDPDLREYDSIVSVGEQVTAGLLSLILQEMGVPARSWLG